MFKLKKDLLLFKILLVCFGMVLIINNQIYGSSKKHGKNIDTSKDPEKITKKDVKNYFELYNLLENYSEEDRNKIIEMLSNEELTKIFKETAQQKEEKPFNQKGEGSSSKKPNNSKK